MTKNNFKKYGFTSEHEGEILKETDKWLIGYLKNIKADDVTIDYLAIQWQKETGAHLTKRLSLTPYQEFKIGDVIIITDDDDDSISDVVSSQDNKLGIFVDDSFASIKSLQKDFKVTKWEPTIGEYCWFMDSDGERFFGKLVEIKKSSFEGGLLYISEYKGGSFAFLKVYPESFEW